MKQHTPQKKFMLKTIEKAIEARDRGDYAFGAAIIKGDKIIASGGNRVVTKNDSTKHVELEVIQYAEGMTTDRYLNDCILYTTCEPCIMCLGACWWAGIRHIIYGISQDDLDRYGKMYGSKQFRYRSSPVPSSTLIDRYKIPMKMEQFMQQECQAILPI